MPAISEAMSFQSTLLWLKMYDRSPQGTCERKPMFEQQFSSCYTNGFNLPKLWSCFVLIRIADAVPKRFMSNQNTYFQAFPGKRTQSFSSAVGKEVNSDHVMPCTTSKVPFTPSCSTSAKLAGLKTISKRFEVTPGFDGIAPCNMYRRPHLTNAPMEDEDVAPRPYSHTNGPEGINVSGFLASEIAIHNSLELLHQFWKQSTSCVDVVRLWSGQHSQVR